MATWLYFTMVESKSFHTLLGGFGAIEVLGGARACVGSVFIDTGNQEFQLE